MYQFSLRLRPNNQLTLTTGQYKNLHKEVHLTEKQSRRRGKRFHRMMDGIRRNQGLRSDMKSYDRPKYRPRKISPLDITKKSQRSPEPKPRAGFGHPPKPKSFTNASGQKLRECGAAIDHVQVDLDKTYCVTLTLPANHERAFFALSSYSGFCINRLFQPIRRAYGDSCLWFFVWEYQKRGALHLHIAVSHDEKGEAAKISQLLINQWYRILESIQSKSGVDMFCRADMKSYVPREKHQQDAQPMKKGLGRYFSKYAGKKESKQSWYCRKYPVSRFWGCCYALKKIIKEMSLDLKVNFEQLELMEEYAASIVEKILSLSKISYLEQYQFQVNLGTKEHPHIIADGERTTIYIFPDMLMALREHLREIPSYF